jgi:hypothetical protein
VRTAVDAGAFSYGLCCRHYPPFVITGRSLFAVPDPAGPPSRVIAHAHPATTASVSHPSSRSRGQKAA